MHKILLKKKKIDWLLWKVLDVCPEFQNFPKTVRLVIRVNMVNFYWNVQIFLLWFAAVVCLFILKKKGMYMCCAIMDPLHYGSIHSISKITKSKSPDFAQFWMKPSEAFGTGKKLLKDSGENTSVDDLSKMWYFWSKNRRAWLIKLKFCKETNQTLQFKRLQINYFVSGPLHGANISQRFSFTKTTEPRNIQLVSNIWSTYFQPVKISIGSLAAVTSFELVPIYISKVKVTFQICHLENGSKRANFSNVVI